VGLWTHSLALGARIRCPARAVSRATSLFRDPPEVSWPRSHMVRSGAPGSKVCQRDNQPRTGEQATSGTHDGWPMALALGETNSTVVFAGIPPLEGAREPHHASWRHPQRPVGNGKVWSNGPVTIYCVQGLSQLPGWVFDGQPTNRASLAIRVASARGGLANRQSHCKGEIS